MNPKEIIKITFNLVVIYVLGGALLAAVYAYTSPIIHKNREEDKKAKLQAMMPVSFLVNAPESSVEDIKQVFGDSGTYDVSEIDGGVSVNVQADIYKAEIKKAIKLLKKAGATYVEQGSSFTPKKAGDWEPDGHHAEFFEVYDENGEFVAFIVESYAKGYSGFPGIYVSLNRDLAVQKLDILSHAETPGLGDEIEKNWFKDQFKGKDLDHLVIIKGETEDKIQAITGATISTRAVTNGVRYSIEKLQDYEIGSGPAAMEKEAAEEAEAGEARPGAESEGH